MVDEPTDHEGESRTGETLPAEATTGPGRTAPTLGPGGGTTPDTFQRGQVLGDRYEIRSRLGAGGMGEVWLATDLKLRIDVALKSVRPDYLANERLREHLRQEVLAAREVLSPNVCRVFDLQVTDGWELVSMEYVAGRTLAGLLKERTPLPLREARDLAAQFLAGLEAIHDAGLVHRDFKPENVMITAVGRVVVMDLGLAIRPERMEGGVAGTPAYMSPEQARGDPIDARTDVFAAGLVLAEMIAPAGIRDRQKRLTLWDDLRASPPRVPEGPWTPVIRKALSAEPGARYGSARELSRELDGLTLRVEEGEGVEPYPGLAAFTVENAERFFGREAEVEALLRKLGRARLLAVAGPSGAGKTSFVQAGLIPALGKGWGHVVVHPGDRSFEALAQPFRRHGAGVRPRDPPEGALRLAPVNSSGRVRNEDPRNDLIGAIRRWREGDEQALIVLDQFEELFTLNAPEVQERFAELLGRLPLEADVHVLLSMRDDFLLRCREHEALAPAFAELTPLVHPTGAALRRALVQPALSCGYRFEDEPLVDSMLSEVEHERGALPLLAFAAARLWDQRDRDQGTLTRKAYEEVGGVGGALAHHAEETLERIGPSGTPIVREVFRNLVTAEGTRAARDREDLLSVFPEAERERAKAVLDALIDARLLTSYETREVAGRSVGSEAPARTTVPVSSSSGFGSPVVRQRVEIIHESLLSAWPRLVRWQTQDADAAQLRDQLRQAAQAWHERGRSADLLWTGSAYREFAVWRDRYPGGLSAREGEFARAMDRHAHRSRRRRRVAGVSFVVIVSLVAIALAVLWRGSEEARKQAEAANLLSLGRMRLGENPSASLAYAIASLERADNEPARAFATEALWAGPIAQVIVDDAKPCYPAWSNDGRWLAIGGTVGFVLVDGDSGKIRRHGETNSTPIRFSLDGSRLLVRDNPAEAFDVFTVPGLELEKRMTRESGVLDARFGPHGVLTVEGDPEDGLAIWEHPADGIPARRLGRGPGFFARLEPTGEGITGLDNGVLRRWRPDRLRAPPLEVGRHRGENVRVSLGPWSPRAATVDETGEIRVWNLEKGGLEREVRVRADATSVALDAAGRYLVAAPEGPLPRGALQGFDLEAPRGAEPFILRYDDASWLNGMQLHPEGDWLASGHFPFGTLLWNLDSKRPVILHHAGGNLALAFTPEGQLVSTSETHVKLWPLWHGPSSEPRELWSIPEDSGLGLFAPQISRDGQVAVVVDRYARQVLVLPLDASTPVVHEVEAEQRGELGHPALAPDNGRVAVSSGAWGQPEDVGIRVLHLESGDLQILPSLDDSTTPCVFNSPAMGPMEFPLWLSDGRLVSEGALGLRLWDLEDGTSRQLRGCRDVRSFVSLAASETGIVLSLLDPATAPGEKSTLLAYDMSTGVSREITSHGRRLRAVGIDVNGSVLVTGDADGLVRVGPLAEGSGSPHLLYGHSHPVASVVVSPDGRWIASAGEDDTIRVWPMPDLSKPPLHTWAKADLLAKLRSFTNLRVIEDPESSTGYTVEAGPFGGWAEIPTW